MAAVVYHDLDGSAPRVKNRGVVFVDGVAVDVSDPDLIDMARRNRFFDVIDDAPVGKPETMAAMISNERGGLLAEAERLGINVDGRWGLTRLAAEIAAKSK